MKSIKSSTDAYLKRGEKTEDIAFTDIDIDEEHSVNDEFGYPMWSQPQDPGNNGNTEGQHQPVDTEGHGDDSADA